MKKVKEYQKDGVLKELYSRAFLQEYFNTTTRLYADVVFLRNATLVVIFKNPIAFFEYKSKEEYFLEALRKAYKEMGLKKRNIVFKKIVAFKRMEKVARVGLKNSPCVFKEVSKGDFENFANGKLFDLFEDLRKIIRGRDERS